MNRRVRLVAGSLAGLVVLLVAAAAILLTQLDRLIKNGVESAGPDVTGVAVTLDDAKVSIFNGQGRLRGLQIANPAGFETPYAFNLASIDMALDTATVSDEVIEIPHVRIDGASLIAEFDSQGGSNLKSILDFVQSQAGSSTTTDSGTTATPKRVIVREFAFTNGQVRAVSAALKVDQALKIPDIRLRDIGEASGGATAAQAMRVVLQPIIDASLKQARDQYLDAKKDEARSRLKEKAGEKLKDIFNRP